jgi:hypothetical protein
MRRSQKWWLPCGMMAIAGIVLAVTVGAQNPAPKTAPQGSGRFRPLVRNDYLIQDPELGATRLIGLQAESNAPDALGNPTVPSRDRRYFYLPPIALKASEGELLVSATADGAITLPLFWDRPETRRIFEKHLVKYNLLAERANEGQILIVTARAIRIETPPGYVPHVVFGPLENFNFNDYQGIMTANAAPGLAQKFVEDLKKGRFQLSAKIALEGYDFQQNNAVITFEDIADTHYYKNLVGPGGPGRISRHQMANVANEAAASRDIVLTTEFDDPDFRQLVSDLLATVEKKEDNLTNNWSSLDEFFTREGWDPEDFRADLITRSKLDRNSEYASKLRDDVRSVASDKRKGGGFSFGLFGVNLINAETPGENEGYREWARSLTREVLDKWSIKYDEEGKRIIPKSVTAYRNDFSQIRAKGTFRIGQRKRFRSEAIEEIGIHPLYDVLQSPAKMPFEVRQAELARRMKELENNLGSLATLQNEFKNNYIQIETFDMGMPNRVFTPARHGTEPMSGYKECIDIKNKDWKPIIVFGAIENTGFIKNGTDPWWAGGAMRVICSVAEQGDHYRIDANGNYDNHGDDGRYQNRVKVIAVFARKF